MPKMQMLVDTMARLYVCARGGVVLCAKIQKAKAVV